MTDDIKIPVRAFSALAHETRLVIMRKLTAEGENGLCPCHLIEDLEMSNANLSFHLKELENANLVLKERRGKFIHYRANCDFMKLLGDLLLDGCEKYKNAEGNCAC